MDFNGISIGYCRKTSVSVSTSEDTRVERVRLTAKELADLARYENTSYVYPISSSIKCTYSTFGTYKTTLALKKIMRSSDPMLRHCNIISFKYRMWDYPVL